MSFQDKLTTLNPQLGVEIVQTRFKKIHDGLDNELKDYVKDFAAIEEGYSKALQKLVKKYKPADQPSRESEYSKELWNILSEVASDVSQSHIQIKYRLESDLGAAVTMKSKTESLALADIQKFKPQLTKLVKEGGDKYEHMLMRKAKMDKAVPAKRDLYEKKYQEAKVQYDEFLTKWGKEMPPVYTRYEEIDKKQLEFMKQFSKKTVQSQLDNAKLLIANLEKALQSIDSIDAAHDLEKYIEVAVEKSNNRNSAQELDVHLATKLQKEGSINQTTSEGQTGNTAVVSEESPKVDAEGYSIQPQDPSTEWKTRVRRDDSDTETVDTNNRSGGVKIKIEMQKSDNEANNADLQDFKNALGGLNKTLSVRKRHLRKQDSIASSFSINSSLPDQSKSVSPKIEAPAPNWDNDFSKADQTFDAKIEPEKQNQNVFSITSPSETSPVENMFDVASPWETTTAVPVVNSITPAENLFEITSIVNTQAESILQNEKKEFDLFGDVTSESGDKDVDLFSGVTSETQPAAEIDLFGAWDVPVSTITSANQSPAVNNAPLDLFVETSGSVASALSTIPTDDLFSFKDVFQNQPGKSDNISSISPSWEQNISTETTEGQDLFAAFDAPLPVSSNLSPAMFPTETQNPNEQLLEFDIFDALASSTSSKPTTQLTPITAFSPADLDIFLSPTTSFNNPPKTPILESKPITQNLDIISTLFDERKEPQQRNGSSKSQLAELPFAPVIVPANQSNSMNRKASMKFPTSPSTKSNFSEFLDTTPTITRSPTRALPATGLATQNIQKSISTTGSFVDNSMPRPIKQISSTTEPNQSVNIVVVAADPPQFDSDITPKASLIALNRNSSTFNSQNIMASSNPRSLNTSNSAGASGMLTSAEDLDPEEIDLFQVVQTTGFSIQIAETVKRVDNVDKLNGSITAALGNGTYLIPTTINDLLVKLQGTGAPMPVACSQLNNEKKLVISKYVRQNAKLKFPLVFTTEMKSIGNQQYEILISCKKASDNMHQLIIRDFSIKIKFEDGIDSISTIPSLHEFDVDTNSITWRNIQPTFPEMKLSLKWTQDSTASKDPIALEIHYTSIAAQTELRRANVYMPKDHSINSQCPVSKTIRINQQSKIPFPQQ